MRTATDDFAEETRKLKLRAERDRRARLEAEAIAERGLRELYEKKVQIELLGNIAVAASESICVEEALRFALARICQTTGWGGQPDPDMLRKIYTDALQIVQRPR